MRNLTNTEQIDAPHLVPHRRCRRWVVVLLVGVVGSTAIATNVQAFSLGSIESTISGALTGDSGGYEHNPLDGGLGNAVGDIGSSIGGKTDQVGGNILGGIGNDIGSIANHLPFGLGNILDSIVGRYVSLADNYLQTWTGKILGNLLGGIEGKDVGILGAADPAQVNADIGSTIGGDGKGNGDGVASTQAQKQDVFNQNPVAIQQSLDHATRRDNVVATAEPFLGKSGQELIAQEMQSAQANVQSIQSLATKAQGMDVTQDVMKSMTAMVSGQSQLEEGSYQQLMQLNQLQAQSNVVTTDVSESLDEYNRSRHAEAMSGAYGVMEGSANIYLPGVGAVK